MLENSETMELEKTVELGKVRLSDGSYVYNVKIGNVLFYAEDLKDARDLFESLIERDFSVDD